MTTRWTKLTNRTSGSPLGWVAGRYLLVAALLLLGGALAACGSDSSAEQAGTTDDSAAPEAEENDGETVDSAGEATDVENASGEEADGEGTTEEEPEDENEPATPRTPRPDETIYPIFGGTGIVVPDGLEPFSEGDYLELRAPDNRARVVIARVASAGSGLPVTTIDEFLGAASGPDGATVEPSGVTRELFGSEFTGHTIRSEGPPNNARIFPSQDPGNVSWSPLPNADLYLAETDDAVLVFGVVGETVSAMEALLPAMEDTVASLELVASDGQVPAVNYPQSELIGTIGEPQQYIPLTAEPGGPVGLTELFAPMPTGEVQLVNLGTPAVVEAPTGWFVQPNFPGFVVLTDGFTAGPGDHDVVFLMNPNAISAHLLGVERDGEPMPFTAEEMVSTPPDNLVVENVVETTIDGKTTVVADLSIARTATCVAGDACLYAMTNSNPSLALFLKPGGVTRTWWITVDEETTLLIAATTPNTDIEWLDQVQDELLSTLRLS